MPEPIPLHARKPRGPEHPPPPPPPTDPRLQLFPLLPGEDGAAWTRHAGEVLDGLVPIDGLKRKLAAAVGMWPEGRADRIEALRCRTAAAIATGRALRLFLAQRRASATGLLGQADTEGAMRTCEPDARPRTFEPDTASCTPEPERLMGTIVAACTSEPEQPASHVRTRRTAAHIRTQAASVDDPSRRAAAHVRTQAAAVRPA